MTGYWNADSDRDWQRLKLKTKLRAGEEEAEAMPNNMKATFFYDARDAIRGATLIAGAVGKPRAIGYVQGKGWRVYDPTLGAPDDAVPEFLVLGLGKLPLPLSEDACEVLRSVLRAEGVLRP